MGDLPPGELGLAEGAPGAGLLGRLGCFPCCRDESHPLLPCGAGLSAEAGATAGEDFVSAMADAPGAVFCVVPRAFGSRREPSQLWRCLGWESSPGFCAMEAVLSFPVSGALPLDSDSFGNSAAAFAVAGTLACFAVVAIAGGIGVGAAKTSL
jgi:hypothetical protein